MNLPKKIIKEHESLIRQKSVDVEFPLKAETLDVIEKMINYVDLSQSIELARKYNLKPAIGISAIQIGFPKKMFYINNANFTLFLINPTIVEHSYNKCYLINGEGCLSVDKIVSDNKVYRYNKVKVKGFNYIENKNITMEFEGFDAIVVQHEIDHLKGILFTDYINNEFKNNPGNSPIPIE
ncbi:MAG: peptide deformylase [Mycoplasma sp.]